MTSIFNKLDINNNSALTSALLHSFEIISARLGVSIKNPEIFNKLTVVNFHSYLMESNIIAHKLEHFSWREMCSSIYPILLELNCENGIRVFTGNCNGNGQLYNPYTKQHEKLSSPLEVKAAWQCFGVNVPLSGGYFKLMKYIFNSFKIDILKLLMYGSYLSAVMLLTAIMSGYIIANVHDIEQNSLANISISLILFIISAFFISYVGELKTNQLSIKVLLHTFPTVWYRLLISPLRLSKGFVSGDVVQRLFDFESTLLTCVTASWSILLNTFILFLLIIYMAHCNWLLAALYFLLCSTIFIIKTSFFRKNIYYLANKFKVNGQCISIMSDILLQIHKVRTSGNELNAINYWFQKQIQIKKLEERGIKTEIKAVLLESFLPVMLFLTLCLALISIPESLRLTTILPFMYCASRFNATFEQLAGDTNTLIHFIPAFNRIKPVAELRPEISENKKCNHCPNGKIELRNIKLTSMDSHKMILNNVSLTVNPGSFVGLIGASGAGKSSIFRLILGFDVPDSGSIYIDDDNINDLDLQFMRKQFGVVLQTTNILPGSIYSNIAANTNLTIHDAWKLAEQVGFADEIQKMPMKMHTHISDNPGESISGGQKQKILIARALATKPKVLLLDEATSALDNKSQTIIYDSLKALHITRFVIAHRYSTIVSADKIYVLEKGEIVNSGTYCQLFN